MSGRTIENSRKSRSVHSGQAAAPPAMMRSAAWPDRIARAGLQHCRNGAAARQIKDIPAAPPVNQESMPGAAGMKPAARRADRYRARGVAALPQRGGRAPDQRDANGPTAPAISQQQGPLV